jgi:hypothetical protein
MNEEKVKRGRGRPIGGISHVGISASELIKYCAYNPSAIIPISRVFWDKNKENKTSPINNLTTIHVLPEDTDISVIETNDQPRVFGDMFMQTIPVNSPQIEMSLSE